MFGTPRGIATDGRTLFVVDKTPRLQWIDPASGACRVWWRTPEWRLGKPTGLTIGPASAGVARGIGAVPAARPERPGGPAWSDRVAAGTPVIYVPDTHYHRVLVYPIPRFKDTSRAVATPTSPAAPDSERSAAVASMFTVTTPESHPPILAQWGSYGKDPGQFIYVTDVAVLTGDDGVAVERFYVSEYGGNDRISCFDAEFRFLFAFGSQGSSDRADAVEFERPQAIEIDKSRRELVVTDCRNHRIGRFTYDGALVAWLGAPEKFGSGPGEMKFPWTIKLLGDGTALVVENGNSRVNQIDLETGRSVRTWGRAGRGPGELAAPWAVELLDGKAWVLDTGNQRLVAFDAPRGGPAAPPSPPD
jgi:hypothetical protein